MKFLNEAYLGILWWVEDIIDWIGALVEKYSYQGLHRGVYDWNIGSGEAFWEKGLLRGWRIRFVDSQPHYMLEGMFSIPPDEEPPSAVLLLKPAEALTSIRILGE